MSAPITDEHRKLAREIDDGANLPKAWWTSDDERTCRELWIEWAAQLLADHDAAVRERTAKELNVGLGQMVADAVREAEERVSPPDAKAGAGPRFDEWWSTIPNIFPLRHEDDKLLAKAAWLAARAVVGQGSDALRSLRELSEKADNAYCDYIAQMKRPECLGYEAKIKDGTFSKVELDAHVRAGELLGRHKALAEVRSQLSAFAPVSGKE